MQDSFLFVQIQTKESRVKQKIASFRPDSDESRAAEIARAALTKKFGLRRKF